MRSLLLQHPFFTSPAERSAQAQQATARGAFLDPKDHGDVAVLQTPAIELAFICGIPVAYLDKTTNTIFVSDDLKLSEPYWHREQIEAIWNRRSWTWTDSKIVAGALLCRREHDPRCRRPHNEPCNRRHGVCNRPHHEKCTKPHLSQPRSKAT